MHALGKPSCLAAAHLSLSFSQIASVPRLGAGCSLTKPIHWYSAVAEARLVCSGGEQQGRDSQHASSVPNLILHCGKRCPVATDM